MAIMENSPQLYSWPYAIVLALVFILLIVSPFFMIPIGPYLLLFGFVVMIIIAPLESLLLTPMYRLNGRFVYLSPLLLATHSAKRIDLHIGTLFDYAYHMKTSDCGKRAQLIVLNNTLLGLRNVCEQMKNNQISGDTQLYATSYFFNHRTAQKLGFKQVDTGFAEQLNLFSVYLSLLIRLSFTRGELTFPNITEIKKITTTAGELVIYRAYIEQMHAKVEHRLARQA